jgi:hypothetical protein
VTLLIVLYLIWYQKPYGCIDNYFNARAQCRINFPDQNSIGYTYCIGEADQRFYRCLNGEPYRTTPGPELP